MDVAALLIMFPKIWCMENQVTGLDLGFGKFQFDFDSEEDILEVRGRSQLPSRFFNKPQLRPYDAVCSGGMNRYSRKDNGYLSSQIHEAGKGKALANKVAKGSGADLLVPSGLQGVATVPGSVQSITKARRALFQSDKVDNSGAMQLDGGDGQATSKSYATLGENEDLLGSEWKSGAEIYFDNIEKEVSLTAQEVGDREVDFTTSVEMSSLKGYRVSRKKSVRNIMTLRGASYKKKNVFNGKSPRRKRGEGEIRDLGYKEYCFW